MRVLFCSITSKYRLHQFVAMYHSLRHFIHDADLAVLTVDRESEEALNTLQLPGVMPVSACKLEDCELKLIKEKRNSSEYCWTLKPVLLLHLYETYSEYDIIAYFDSDILFFDDPLRLFAGNRKWSVLLTTHKVNRRANGGFVAFSRCMSAYEALKWWKERCLEWCYSINDNGRFADQGYLDFMKTRFRGVLFLDNPGANLAVWNYFNYDIVLKDGKLLVGRSPLIFYHFSGLRTKKISSSVAICGDEAPCPVCRIYITYLKAAIEEIEKVDRKVTDHFYSGI